MEFENFRTISISQKGLVDHIVDFRKTGEITA